MRLCILSSIPSTEEKKKKEEEEERDTSIQLHVTFLWITKHMYVGQWSHKITQPSDRDVLAL